MKALLDTQVFLWAFVDDPRLSARAREFLRDGDNDLYLSVASVWEIVIKAGIGKLTLPEDPRRYVTKRLAMESIEDLPLRLEHALQVSSLPDLHRDPFDRILIAQSQIEELPVITSDPVFRRYGAEIIW